MKTCEIAVKGRLITCCKECPHQGTDGGGPGTVLVCEHPVFDWAAKVVSNNRGIFSPYYAAILHNEEMKLGFPDLCPFFHGGSKL